MVRGVEEFWGSALDPAPPPLLGAAGGPPAFAQVTLLGIIFVLSIHPQVLSTLAQVIPKSPLWAFKRPNVIIELHCVQAVVDARRGPACPVVWGREVNTPGYPIRLFA